MCGQSGWASLAPPAIQPVAAHAPLHWSRNIKYSSPIFLISISPQPVPTSVSCSSSGRDTMVAPHTRAMRLLSVLRTRRMAVMPAFWKKWEARSDTPFSVMTTSGRSAMTSPHTLEMKSSSCFRMASKSSSRVISTLVALSAFLYSSCGGRGRQG